MSKPLQIAIIVLCLGAAAYFLYGYVTKPSPTAEEGVPEYFHFVCGNPACGNTFDWQRGEDTGDRDIDTCPKCGTPEAFRAAKCQECGLYQPLKGHGTFERTCPKCGAQLPPLRDQK